MSSSRAKKKQRRRTRAASEPAAAERAAQRLREREGAAPARAEPDRASRSPAPPVPRFEVRDGVARPEPIWSPVPLTEIGILVGIVIFMIGYFASRSPELLGIGAIVLAVVVGEMCLREHFAGFRSHGTLLALLPVTVVHTFVVYAITPAWHGPLALLVDLAVAGALGWFLFGRFRKAHAAARTRAAA